MNDEVEWNWDWWDHKIVPNEEIKPINGLSTGKYAHSWGENWGEGSMALHTFAGVRQILEGGGTVKRRHCSVCGDPISYILAKVGSERKPALSVCKCRAGKERATIMMDWDHLRHLVELT